MQYYDRARPYLSRFVLAPIGVLVANYAASKFGVQIDSEAIRVAIDLAIYGAIHKSADKIINPADTSSHHLAVEGVEAKSRIVQ
jgi:hypothetical protein